MIFRQLFDTRSSTYTYLLASGGQAVVIDPVFEHARRDAALIRELGLVLVDVVETHVHADHVTGASRLKTLLGGRIGLSARSGAEGADRYLKAGDTIPFGSRHLIVRETPGHTDGCLTYVLDDERMAFTGDALLIRGAGRTDFQQGSAKTLFSSIHTQIFSLPETCLLYPAHDYSGRTCSSVAEEKVYNPRIGTKRSEGDFVGYMENLNLPHPRRIDEAVPANLQCGRTSESEENVPTWAALEWTYAGIWKITPQELYRIRDDVQIIDVREPDEFDGPLGHIQGAVLLPLGQLPDRIEGIDATRPVVTVCRSGARSAQAVVLLRKAGLTALANLEGGMLFWGDQAFPVACG